MCGSAWMSAPALERRRPCPTGGRGRLGYGVAGPDPGIRVISTLHGHPPYSGTQHGAFRWILTRSPRWALLVRGRDPAVYANASTRFTDGAAWAGGSQSAPKAARRVDGAEGTHHLQMDHRRRARATIGGRFLVFTGNGCGIVAALRTGCRMSSRDPALAPDPGRRAEQGCLIIGSSGKGRIRRLLLPRWTCSWMASGPGCQR
jgi:hypothetical protein